MYYRYKYFIWCWNFNRYRQIVITSITGMFFFFFLVIGQKFWGQKIDFKKSWTKRPVSVFIVGQNVRAH